MSPDGAEVHAPAPRQTQGSSPVIDSGTVAVVALAAGCLLCGAMHRIPRPSHSKPRQQASVPDTADAVAGADGRQAAVGHYHKARLPQPVHPPRPSPAAVQPSARSAVDAEASSPEAAAVATSTAEVNRVEEARGHGWGGLELAAVAAEAERLMQSKLSWTDPDFPHGDRSLFKDPDNPPADWLRDGERGQPLAAGGWVSMHGLRSCIRASVTLKRP